MFNNNIHFHRLFKRHFVSFVPNDNKIHLFIFFPSANCLQIFESFWISKQLLHI